MGRFLYVVWGVARFIRHGARLSKAICCDIEIPSAGLPTDQVPALQSEDDIFTELSVL